MSGAVDGSLTEIKDFIISALGPIYGPGDGPALGDFLDRLIGERDGIIVKEPLEIKAGRQLLCSIGIDIKHGIVPEDRYREIFRAIRMDELDREARKLFRAAILEHNLFYLSAEERKAGEFTVIVFALKDLHYYYDGMGITGRTEVQLVKKKLGDYRKSRESLPLSQPKFDKNRDDRPSRYFWVTTRQHIEDMTRNVEQSRATRRVIDRMGLSHFDLEDENQQDFFYVDFGEAEFTTFKPNATLVDWDSPLTGFLSCWKRQPAGHTFPITGYKNFREGVSERMFLKASLTPEQQNKAFIQLFESSAQPPISIETEDLITEGITRFKA